ncbi:hypothetical protein PVK06_048498 [Gossypium arboreum]|uniref:Uncharacterized protein n=1 Tax=Gossypium arboreum TaxID=29729 RepID=A0ABR0MIS9_GOSAR|nr:hypothetical protein PVK06_048498 [Gossypium arboreum]
MTNLCRKGTRGPLNPRRRDDEAGSSTAPTQSLGSSTVPIQSPGPLTASTQSSGPTLQPITPTSQPFQIMLGVYPSPFMYPNLYMFPFSNPMTGSNAWPGSSLFSITLSGSLLPSHEGSHEAPSGSSSFYQSPSPYEIQTPSPWVMQTPLHSLFY